MGIGLDVSSAGLRTLQQTSINLLKGFQKLSSGRRITRAADDAAGLALAQKLTAFERSARQGVRNLNDGVSAVQVAEGALSETSDMLVRMRELAVAAGNGTLGDAERAVIQEEYDALASEIERVSRTTDFNGRPLLDGSLQGAGGLVVTDGLASDDLEVEVADSGSGSLGIQGLAVGEGATLDALDSALGRVAQTRAGLGIAESRLVSRIRDLNVSIENHAAARSRIEDLDFARGVASQTRNQLLQRAGVSVRGQANFTADTVLRLLE